MKRLRSLVVFVLLNGSIGVTLLAGCHRSKETVPAQGIIFYMEDMSDGCEWQLINPHSLEKRALFKTRSCPDKIIWDSRHQQTLYTLGPSSTALVYQVSWN